MARSLKKGPFVHYSLEKKVQENINVGQNLDDYNNKYNKLEKYIKQKNEIITAENDCLYYSSNSNKEPKIPINFEYDNGEKIIISGHNIVSDGSEIIIVK